MSKELQPTNFTEGKILGPLIAVIIACISNILGDLLFVAVFGMGSAGATLATPCSTVVQIAMCLVFMLYLKKKGEL